MSSIPDATPDSIGGPAVHVWSADLLLDSRVATLAERLLQEHELARSDRFQQEIDRSRYVAVRGALRIILGSYMGREPRDVRIVHTSAGKPATDPVEGEPLFFSLSHSDDLAAIAVTRIGQIGVDIERLRHLPDAAEIAERFFSRREQEMLSDLPESERSTAFLRCWTRKEAYVKATGKGIGSSFGDFDVELRDGFAPQFIALSGDPVAAARWTLSDIRLRPGFAGAFAIESTGISERFFHFEPDQFGL